MTNTLVPHEIAVELKEKGFSEPCTHYYDSDGLHDYGGRNSERYQDFNNRVGYEDCYSIPDIYQAAAWLRGKGISVVANEHYSGWYYEVNRTPVKIGVINKFASSSNDESQFPDHDTAYIAGIANAVKLVK